MKYTYKSLLCLGDYKEDTYYIVLSTGDLKKSVAHKASVSKIFLSAINELYTKIFHFERFINTDYMK